MCDRTTTCTAFLAHLLPVVPLKISCRCSAILLIVILFLELSIWAQVQLGVVLDIWLSLMAI